MSYVVLARRYRPKLFRDLVGQEHVAQTLRNAVKLKRIAHAYLFTGPRGVGKTSAARIMAKAIRCENLESDGEPCNKCASCLEINLGSGLDVIEIDAASNTGVDNIRDLRDNVEYMAAQGTYRVYIIDEVHMLSTAAFNALLKTLEEPPPHVIFIFATTEIHKVLPTILSRCQRFDFKRVPFDKMSKNLREICALEKVEIDEASLRSIVVESDGCLRDAQSLLDQAIAFCGSNIQLKGLEEALGLLDRGLFFDLLRAIFKKDSAATLQLGHRMLAQGVDPKVLLGRLTEFYRDLHFRYFTQKSLSQDPDVEALFEEIKPSLVTDELVRGLDLCLKLQSSLYGASSTDIALESLLIRLTLQRPATASPSAQPARETRSAPPSLPTPSYQAPAASRPAECATPSAPVRSEAVLKPDATLKDRLESYLRQNKSAWLPVLQSLQAISLEGDEVRASVRADFAGKRLASNDGVELLKQCFQAKRAVVEVAKDSAPQVNAVDRRAEIQTMAREHEGVQAALRVFDAVITDTKILNENPRKNNKRSE